MISDEGFVRNTQIRKAGEAEKTFFCVNYDREYVIAFIAKVICGSLFVLGRERILALVGEAWDTYYGKQPVRARVDREAS